MGKHLFLFLLRQIVLVRGHDGTALGFCIAWRQSGSGTETGRGVDAHRLGDQIVFTPPGISIRSFGGVKGRLYSNLTLRAHSAECVFLVIAWSRPMRLPSLQTIKMGRLGNRSVNECDGI